MIHHVDLGSVLRRSVSDLYTNLVTRSTGAAVRAEIEQQLAAQSLGGGSARLLAIIDFAHVGLLDYSCADEVVAKLLLRYAAPGTPHETPRGTPYDAYFVLRGAQEAHVDAIEAALARYGLALVAEGIGPAGDARLLGAVPEDERQVWDAAYRLGTADAGRVAAFLESDGHPAGNVDGVARTLDALMSRRLVIRLGGRATAEYVAVGRAECMLEVMIRE
jgi:hypothetical protein